MKIETKLALLVGGITAVNARSTVDGLRTTRDITYMFLNESTLSAVTNYLVPDIYLIYAKDDPKSAFFCVHFAANEDYAEKNPFWPTTATRALSSNLNYKRGFADYELGINADRIAYGYDFSPTGTTIDYRIFWDICISKK